MGHTAMTSRERVMAALDHREPDRIPRDIGGTFTTGLHVSAYSRLMTHLGMDPGPEAVDNYQVRTAVLDPRLVARLGSDCVALKTTPPTSWKLKFSTDDKGYRHYIDEWRVDRACPPDGYYYDVVSSPLAGATLADIERFPWPDPSDPGRLAGLEERARALYEGSDKCIILSTGTSLFAQIAFMMGWEEFLFNTAANPELIRAFVDRLLSFNENLVRATLARVGPYVQIFNMYDDLTHQRNMFVSKKTLNEIFLPAYKKLFDVVKSAADVKVLFHMCGASRLLFDELIEAGVDAFNPIQVAAEGMDDTAELKRLYGDRMTFWGGGCDTQDVLPHGTPDDVRHEVRRRIGDLAPGGGFVFTAVHNIQCEVPPENIVAMYDELSRWDSYPISLETRRPHA